MRRFEGKGAMNLNRFVLGAIACAGFAATSAFAELPVEPTPASRTLPAEYPDSFVFLVDGNFWGIESGKVVIADVGHEWDHHRGAVGSAQFGYFAAAKTRPELYVVETFYDRGHRGKRTDVITIYDKATLNPTGEIVLPGGKRAQTLTEQGAFQLSSDERYAYVFNFTPASSVTVVDLEKRKIVGDVDIPGCVHAFALKGGGFASLCGNGGVVSTKLDENGKQVGQTMSAPFNDIDNEPMFTRPAIIGGVGYFPTYHGKIQEIDFNGDEAVVGESWPIVLPDAAEGGKRLFGLMKAKKPEHRLPSGWQLISSDDAGRIYLLMRATETIDDHDTGGDEVWVIDPKSRNVIDRIKLRGDSQLIEVTAGEDPYLVALNMDMSLDVLKASNGEFVRRIGGQMVMSPFAIVGNK
ncbi:MAG: amine dehydrogenase large subunit [Parvularculaceae bacterium]